MASTPYYSMALILGGIINCVGEIKKQSIHYFLLGSVTKVQVWFIAPLNVVLKLFLCRKALTHISRDLFLSDETISLKPPLMSLLQNSSTPYDKKKEKNEKKTHKR